MKITAKLRASAAMLFSACSLLTATALPTSHFATSSKLAAGRWVKIRITEPGMQQITYDQLRQWGFSDPSKVYVFGFSTINLASNNFTDDLPDDLPAVKIHRVPGEKIVFYSEGSRRIALSSKGITATSSAYSDYTYFFVTDAVENPDWAPPVVGVNTSNSRYKLTSHNAFEYHEEDLTNLSHGGSIYLGESFLDKPLELKFTLTDYLTSTSPRFFYRYATGLASSVSTITVKPAPGGDITTSSISPTSVSFGGVNRHYYLSGTGSMSFGLPKGNPTAEASVTLALPSGINPSSANLDWAGITYSRLNDMGGRPQMRFDFLKVQQSQNFTVAGASASSKVWYITPDGNVYNHMTHWNKSTQMLLASFISIKSQEPTFIVFDPSKELNPVEFAGEVSNQDIHSMAVPDMVIIAPAAYITQAEELAAVHREHSGLEVAVLDQQAIFNEFSSGTPSAMAYRLALKMFYDRDPQKLKYLLLFGTGTWDNRHIVFSDRDYLLTYQTEKYDYASRETMAYCSDDYFGYLDDSFDGDNIPATKLNLGVGRLPVSNITEASAIVEKIREYITNPPLSGSYNRVMITSDDGDANSHLLQAEESAKLITELAPYSTVTKLYNALYPFNAAGDAEELRNATKLNFAIGQNYWVYSGHANPSHLMSGECLWENRLVETTSYEVPPIVMLSTCETYGFDRLEDCITERMIKRKGGGAIGVVASGRTVYQTHNQAMSLAMTRALYSAPAGSRMGDVYRNAKNEIADNESLAVNINSMSYNLAGDPAIPIFIPSRTVNTVAVDDNAIATTDGLTTVHPLVPFNLSGTITDTDGNTDTDFNGQMTITFHDGIKNVMSSLKGDPGQTSQRVEIDETPIASVVVPVMAGRWEAVMTVPEGLVNDTINRINYYAYTDDHSTFASGYFKGLSLTPYDPSLVENPDVTPPVITECYLDDPSFANGDETGSTTTLYASIAPDASGLNCSSASIGHGARLKLDNARSFPEFRTSLKPAADGSYSISQQLSGLTDGHHTVTLTVDDNAGNQTSRTLNFLVRNRSGLSEMNVEEAPARTQATFTLTDETATEYDNISLIVRDALGNTVFRAYNVTLPYSWNLKGNDGSRVADGHYNAFLLTRNGRLYGHTPAVEFIVVE